MSRRVELDRISRALALAARVLEPFVREAPAAMRKSGGEVVTEADHAVDAALRETLPAAGEGWLSEETADDGERLRRARVWIVDPLDGTRELLRGIPDWCVSVGLVEDGRPVAGGILHPPTGEVFLGAPGLGITANGAPARVTHRTRLDGAAVLASRSETGRGEWGRYAASGLQVRPVGSVALKLALVAVGRADATWTLSPKNEWDVAGGAALVLAAGGVVLTLDGEAPRFNLPSPRLAGFVACAAGLEPQIRRLLELPGGTSTPDR